VDVASLDDDCSLLDRVRRNLQLESCGRDVEEGLALFERLRMAESAQMEKQMYI